MTPCEYVQCTYREEDQGLCCFEGKEESCPLWKSFSTKAKQKDIESHRITRKVRLPDMSKFERGK
jgi:hypothetical protein